MVKGRETKSEPQIGAFSRMNYLYQAAHLMANISPQNPIVNYYNKIMKEISKKVVEKLHPDLKRTICVACSYPLAASQKEINANIKPFKKKKKKKKLKRDTNDMPEKKEENISSFKKYKEGTPSKSYKGRIKIRNKRVNNVKWCCSKCGFSKSYLQQPSYELWIHKSQSVDID